MIRRFSCFYEILKVTKNATKAEIKAAYFQLVKSHHPDQSGETEYFQKVKQAYETLTEDEKRFEYDLEKGYLNAIDIDTMENNLKIYGTRYITDEIQAKLAELQTPQSQKPKPQTATQPSPLFQIRFKFFMCLCFGFPISYSLALYFLETFIYPTTPMTDFIKHS